MRKFLLILLSTYCAVFFVNGTTLKIGLLTYSNTKSALITPTGNGYYIKSGNEIVGDLLEGDAIKVQVVNGKIKIRTLKTVLGEFDAITLVKKEWRNTFKIKSTEPSYPEKSYRGDLIIIPGTDDKLKFINKVDLEVYLEGVTESETGSGQVLEFYKAQAVISRTYALSNVNRHAAEGFELCDGVHCQAYKGRMKYNPEIRLAVNATREKVIVDANIELITCSFHSNCGGQTCNSEDVWGKALPYLRSVKDTFCIHSNNAHWKKTVSENTWVNYLHKENYPVKDTLAYECAINFEQNNRMKYFGTAYDNSLPLTKIRSDWKLKSTYFTIDEQDGKIVLVGKGFGHGVGLCQEGAMEMAKLNYSYTDILHFYYTNVHIIDLKYLIFFRE